MGSTHSILLAIDDPGLRQTLAEHLEAAGHRVGTWSGPEETCDLVVVDDRRADAAGLCRAAKAAPGAPRVLVVGAALAGADAWVARPLRLAALIAQAAVLLGRRPGGARMRLGDWDFDPAGRHLSRRDGTRVRLTDKETAILSFLAEAGGTVTREHLLAKVWGYSAAVTTHTLETHIYRLRRKLERDPARAEILVTEDGGYRLVPGH